VANGHKYCSLILPEPDWTHWDAEAEKVHRIARDVLDTWVIQETYRRTRQIAAIA
jgi:hypothetical protein